ncbi:GTP-binding protein [Salinispirillum sp. LH 10-3-1]|uniref:GTP-binding protein n=1 Tax=Salinispirillum sp. LH 10-3-1 TaxID=2952525 RepID=A0AB38YEV7_9GAMM
MSAPYPLVIVNLLLGFLGVGKTTAIRHLLGHKPANERWAVLVNEFGDVGVDGKVLGDTGIVVKQVAGGCMCCASGPVTRVALNQLIRQERPDRLLIEPSGLGHPKTILALLQDDSYRTVLRVQSPLTLVDARQVVQSRYQNHALYVEQILLAGALVLNKSDLADSHTQRAAEAWLATQRPEVALFTVEQGQVDLDWFLNADESPRVSVATQAATAELPVLDWRSIPAAPTAEQWVRAERNADGYFSVGWRMPAQTVWRTHDLLAWVHSIHAVRLKAVMCMDDGWRLINVVDGALSIVSFPAQQEAVLELILDHALDSKEAEVELRRCTLVN